MLISFLLVSPVFAASDVLFVGNSYTMYNNLDATVAAVFAAAGEEVQTARVAAGGLTLSDHASRAADSSSAWHTKLVTEAADREWVVLQDQSQTPGFPMTEVSWMASRDGAVALNELIVAAEAETMFFLTWGYVDGDSRNDWLYPDYTAMQGHLTLGYKAYAEACATAERPVWIAPVGPAYAYIHDQIVASGEDPLATGALFKDLYSGDGSHPGPLGTQLAAYVFYASLSGENPVGLTAPEGLDAERVLVLQEAAAAVVFDSSDDFVFPWEDGTEMSDTGSAPTDTGEDAGSSDADADGAPTDTGATTPPDESDDESNGTASDADSPGPGDYPATLEEEDDDKGGCSHAGQSSSTVGWFLLLSTLLVRRKKKQVTS